MWLIRFKGKLLTVSISTVSSVPVAVCACLVLNLNKIGER